MSGARDTFYGPISYSPVWLIIGIVLFVAAIAIIVAILYVTRRREIRSIGNLRVTAPKVVNMNVLRDKYIKLINQAEESFRRRQIKASECHQKISLLVRMFYYEGMGFRADVMTLDDLKKSNHRALIEFIDKMYPAEFDTLENGAVADAADRARKIVRSE